MADQTTNYKCPACTGPLHFQGSTGRLECEYCGSSYEVAEIEAMLASATEKASAAKEASDAREARMSAEEREAQTFTDENGNVLKSYNCPSCGAELVCDEQTVATSCPYCGNPTVVPGVVKGEFKPDFMIPFKLDKEAALAALKEFYKGKKFLPNNFVDDNHLDEIKGVYVPFWLYDGSADARAEYSATISRSYTTATERVTETDHYYVRRCGTMAFERVPADASTKMPDEYMDAVEPFDFSELRPYSHAYLPGFLANTWDVPVDGNKERINRRITETALSVLRNDVTGYQTVSVDKSDVDIDHRDARYAMLPVWMLSTKWNGQSFLFAMNGQTGKLVGNLPVDMGKFWMMFAMIGIPLAALFSAAVIFMN